MRSRKPIESRNRNPGSLLPAEAEAFREVGISGSEYIDREGSHRQSTNYNGTDVATQDATSGWRTEADGDAEFNDLTARGRVGAAQFASIWESTAWSQASSLIPVPTSTAGWQSTPGTTLAYHDPHPEGAAGEALSVTNTSGGTFTMAIEMADTISAKPGFAYAWRAVGGRTTGDAAVLAQSYIRFYDALGTLLGSAFSAKSVFDTSTETVETVYGVAPPGAISLRAGVIYYNTPNGDRYYLNSNAYTDATYGDLQYPWLAEVSYIEGTVLTSPEIRVVNSLEGDIDNGYTSIRRADIRTTRENTDPLAPYFATDGDAFLTWTAQHGTPGSPETYQPTATLSSAGAPTNGDREQSRPQAYLDLAGVSGDGTKPSFARLNSDVALAAQGNLVPLQAVGGGVSGTPTAPPSTTTQYRMMAGRNTSAVISSDFHRITLPGGGFPNGLLAFTAFVESNNFLGYYCTPNAGSSSKTRLDFYIWDSTGGKWAGAGSTIIWTAIGW